MLSHPATSRTRQPSRFDAIRSGTKRSLVAFLQGGGLPEAEIADSVGYLIGPTASYMNGHTLVVDGGWLGR